MNKANTTGKHPDSTLSAPNVKKIIHSVAMILENQMRDDNDKKKVILKQSDLFFFSEEKYILEKSEEFDDSRVCLLRAVPSMKNIEEFIQAIYDCTSFSASPFLPENWRPVVFISLLIAQKVWDDLNYSNAYFADIYPFFTNEEVNRLEEHFLELIDYNLVITSQLYAKYYFELSTLFSTEVQDEVFPLNPLDAEMAFKLESKSSEVEKISSSQRKSKTMN